MKFFAATLILASAVLVSGVARADSDDKIWIAQCVRDNAVATVATPVLLKYCKCMNDKMDDNETRTITEWEGLHPGEKAACRTKAKWDDQAPSVPAPAVDSPRPSAHDPTSAATNSRLVLSM